MSSPDNVIPTPEQNAENIAALTQAVGALVSQFIRPAAQQANANRETLERVVDLLERHATGLLILEERLEDLSGIVSQVAQQQQANAQQIAAIGNRLEQFDQRLEETRALVASNGSWIAQLSTKQNQFIDEQRERSEALDQKIDRLVEENRAFRESQQSQLAAIIGNARRIDRLEQQAS